MDVSWNDNATDEAGYRVLYRSAGGAWTSIALNANSTSARITGLPTATTHQFRVEAFNAVGSNSSTTVSRSTLSAFAGCDAGTTSQSGSAGSTYNAWGGVFGNECYLDWGNRVDYVEGYTRGGTVGQNTWAVIKTDNQVANILAIGSDDGELGRGNTYGGWLNTSTEGAYAVRVFPATQRLVVSAQVNGIWNMVVVPCGSPLQDVSGSSSTFEDSRSIESDSSCKKQSSSGTYRDLHEYWHVFVPSAWNNFGSEDIEVSIDAGFIFEACLYSYNTTETELGCFTGSHSGGTWTGVRSFSTDGTNPELMYVKVRVLNDLFFYSQDNRTGPYTLTVAFK